jgi:hypothetical protein
MFVAKAGDQVIAYGRVVKLAADEATRGLRLVTISAARWWIRCGGSGSPRWRTLGSSVGLGLGSARSHRVTAARLGCRAAGESGYLPGGVTVAGSGSGLMRCGRPPVIAKLPGTPGVYRFRDGGGRVLYIGRAGSLRGWVASY